MEEGKLVLYENTLKFTFLYALREGDLANYQ